MNLDKLELLVVAFALTLLSVGGYGLSRFYFHSDNQSVASDLGPQMGVVTRVERHSDIQLKHSESFLWGPLTESSSIYPFDSLFVGPNSQVEVTLDNSTSLVIGGDSLVTFQPAKTSSEGSSDLALFVEEGEVSVVANQNAENGKDAPSGKLDVTLAGGNNISFEKGAAFTISKRADSASLVVSKPKGEVQFSSGGKQIKTVKTDGKKAISIEGIKVPAKTVALPSKRSIASEANSVEKENPVEEMKIEEIKTVEKEEDLKNIVAKPKARPRQEVEDIDFAIFDDPPEVKTPTTSIRAPASTPTALAMQGKTTTTTTSTSSTTTTSTTSTSTTTSTTPKVAKLDSAGLSDGEKIDYRTTAVALSFSIKSEREFSSDFELAFSLSSQFLTELFRMKVKLSEMTVKTEESPATKEKVFVYTYNLSGLYVALNPILRDTISKYKRVYWRYTAYDQLLGRKLVSQPKLYEFLSRYDMDINSQSKVVELAESSPDLDRRPAAVKKDHIEISWKAAGRIPSWYRLNFYSDRDRKKIFCSAELSPHIGPPDAKQTKIMELPLQFKESYEFVKTQPCPLSEVKVAPKYPLFYTVEALDDKKIPIKNSETSIVKGEIQ